MWISYHCLNVKNDVYQFCIFPRVHLAGNFMMQLSTYIIFFLYCHWFSMFGLLREKSFSWFIQINFLFIMVLQKSHKVKIVCKEKFYRNILNLIKNFMIKVSWEVNGFTVIAAVQVPHNIYDVEICVRKHLKVLQF